MSARPNVVTTGQWEIDRDTGGFRPRFVWVFGAKSHWGKSSFVIQAADENIQRGRRVLIVSSEDSPELYGERLLMRRARVDRYRLQQGRLRADEVDRITNVAARGEDVPVYLDSIGKSVEWAARKVASLVRAEAIDLVCWDYLHAFDKEGAHLDERQKLNHIARVMTDTTKTAGVAGLICAQVTPDTKAPIPDMYEIRGSKDVVNSADGVMIGFMPAAKIERDDNGLRVVVAEAGERCVVVAKNKPGPGPAGRTYRMGSDLEHGCFDVVADPNARHYEAFDREIGDL